MVEIVPKCPHCREKLDQLIGSEETEVTDGSTIVRCPKCSKSFRFDQILDVSVAESEAEIGGD